MMHPIRVLTMTLLGLCIACGAHAQDRRSLPFRAMPEGTWQTLEQAPGIVGGSPSRVASRIQVVFDPNCPYSAKIYRYFKQHHPRTPIRWTPVAYMRADSYALAVAIFHSRDSRTSLDTDLDRYDFAAHRGGLPPPGSPSAEGALGPGQQALQQLWATRWGAFTPMIFFRDRTGRTFKAETDLPDTLEKIVRYAAPPAPDGAH